MVNEQLIFSSKINNSCNRIWEESVVLGYLVISYQCPTVLQAVSLVSDVSVGKEIMLSACHLGCSYESGTLGLGHFLKQANCGVCTL